jgi:putative salt-induced outer membrane protein YdiY
MKSLVLLALVPITVSAQDTTHVAVFHGDLGYVATSGNTQVSTINFADALTLRTSPVNRIDQVFSVVYGQNKNVVQTNIWNVALRDQYSFTKTVGWYALGGFTRNTFAGIEYDFQEGAGFAFTPILPKQHSLEFDAGISYIEQKLLPDSTDHHADARGAITYKFSFAKGAYFQQFVEGLPDLAHEDDFRVNSETDLVAPLSKHFSIKIGYAIHYANQPPPGFRTTDRLFTSDLQVAF